ncbi:MAG: ATP:cob(I)alamin adenosyltransferase, partial [Nitrosopumilales archaeon]|nr:ATP:cob(I)alamin adenosyltransferase [Nitrosopumilales archaeon]
SEKENVNAECKKYLNRLSDLLFVLARIINKRNGITDVFWKQ